MTFNTRKDIDMLRIFGLLLTIFCFSEAYSANGEPERVWYGMPAGEDSPALICTFPWVGGSFSDTKTIVEKDTSSLISAWKSAQDAMDKGDVDSLAALYDDASKTKLKETYGPKALAKAKNRQGLRFTPSGIAYAGEFAILHSKIYEGDSQKMAWLDIFTGGPQWKLTNQLTINSQLPSLVSYYIAQKDAAKPSITKDNISDFSWSIVKSDSLSKWPTATTLYDDLRFMAIGIKKSGFPTEAILLDTYTGNDEFLTHVKNVSQAIARGDTGIIEKSFDIPTPKSGEQYFWANPRVASRQTIVYYLGGSKETKLLILGDDTGPKSVCLVSRQSKGMRILSTRSAVNGLPLPAVLTTHGIIPQLAKDHAR